MSTFSESRVAVYRTENPIYLECPPFHPGTSYPERLFPKVSSIPNAAYKAVRGVLQQAGLDAEHAGTKHWNPLGEFVHAGETILLKPNLVHHLHPRLSDGWRCVMTHGSVIRAVADYVWKAIGPSGKIVLADAPQTDASFSKIVGLLGLDSIRDFYRSHDLAFDLVDLRTEEWTTRDDVIVERRTLEGDPLGNVAFDLGHASEFEGHHGTGHYYGADYDSVIPNRHHSDCHHEYQVAASVLHCDCIINIPKLKTHKKTGVTLSLKNLVGISTARNWLPHHTERSHDFSGDEAPSGMLHRLERVASGSLRRLLLRAPHAAPQVHRVARRAAKSIFGASDSTIRSGNWWGNDTLWRTCLDLNKIVTYGTPDGHLLAPGTKGERRQLVIMDGLVGGQGNGPLDPDPYPAGIVAFGTHGPSVDAACTWLMGFDPNKVALVRQAFRCKQFPLADHGWQDMEVVSNCPEWNHALPEIENTLHFDSSFGWRGHIERNTSLQKDSAA